MEYITLNDGNRIPVLGFGVYGIAKDECVKCVSQALEIGYRHIDAAQIYQNESEVGDAVAGSGLKREELFLTSKIWVSNFGYEKAKASIDRSLERLKTSYLDLMLIHRPYADYKGAWKALEEAAREGKIKSIGISNFNEKQIESLLGFCTITPVVDQIELHPYGQQKQLRQYLASKNIAVQSWSPLGHGNQVLLDDPVLREIAANYGKTVAQIILRHIIQSGLITFPKSCRYERIKSNFEVFDFKLRREDMEKIDALDKNKYSFTLPAWLDTIIAKSKKA